jgi:DNA polymerase III subunit beta
VRFRVERDVFADAVAWTARSLPARPPVPVLAGLLVEASSEGLVLSGFDYEVSTRVAVEADVLEPGRVLVSGRLLADISRSLPERPVEVTTDGPKVQLVCGSARFSLLTLPVDEYPTLPDMPAVTGSVPGPRLASAVHQVAVAAGRDDTLPVLTGIRIELDGDRVTLAATDRYRLAVRELTWSPEQTGLESVALVPARTLAETAKALAVCESVDVALARSSSGEGLVGFDGGGRRTTTRLLEGEFPKYRSLLPTESASVADVDTGALVEAVKRVALVAERNTPVRLTFSGGELQLDAGTGDEAQASEALACSLEGEPLTIAFNPQFLLDGLGAVDSSVTRLSFTTSNKPAVLTGGAADGESGAPGDSGPAGAYRYLLMPVRLSG